MTMPRLSGHETLILSSGYSEEVARDQVADEPISGFLQKPYSPADLLAKVRETLGNP